ncbi:MAG: hypothetical protein HYX38_05155 [Rhodospirillales bacterium]|nr:hypothetical protein [Rhodospirillales bacterium]
MFIVIWIMIGVGMDSYGRRHSATDIRGSTLAAFALAIAALVIRIAVTQRSDAPLIL